VEWSEAVNYPGQRTDRKAAGGDTVYDESRSGAEAALIRVLVADDHPVVRLGLLGLINAQPDMQAVGEAASCAETRAKTQSLGPSVVLLDLQMDDCAGAQSVEQLTAAVDVPIIVYTSHDEDWLVTAAMQAGVHGYVCKGAPAETLIAAIRAVHNGQKFLDPAVTSEVVGQLERPHVRSGDKRTLTAREMDVLRRVAIGRKNSEISRELYVSERTVKFHISALLRKLDAANRAEAVRIGIQLGLLSCVSTSSRAAGARFPRGPAPPARRK
jgi:DNA-binding NarL/FixJ family response regulator